MVASPTPSRIAAYATLWLVPLAVWPGLDHPFSTPKLWCLLAGAAATIGLGVTARPSWPRPMAVVALAWAASVAWSGLLAPIVQPEALLLALAGPAWLAALQVSRSGLSSIASVVVAAGLPVALTALIQAVGLDPFAALGWVPQIGGGSQRLRVYSTLGNPNFVGAWLAMLAPLVAARWMDERHPGLRAITAVTALAVVVAIAASGSRGAALGLGTGLLALVHLRRPRWRWWLTGATAALVAALAASSGARPVATTLQGRLHIWRTILPHALAHPAAGWGPGALELRYPLWEASRTTLEPNGSQFAGPQQHAHNDYLEVLVDRGLPGLVTIALLFTTVVGVAARRSRRSAAAALPAGAVASVMATAAMAAVDFPLHRPAEVMLLWTAVALAHVPPRGLPDERGLGPGRRGPSETVT